MKNKHIIFSLFFLLCLHLPVHAQLQLGLSLGGGRSYTQIDYAQATGSSFEEVATVAIPVGVELSSLLGERWRISLGANLLFQNQSVIQRSGPWFGLRVGEQFVSLHVPLEVQHLVQLGNNNLLVFRLGGSLSLASSPSGFREGTYGLNSFRTQEAATVWYRLDYNQSLAPFLRLGVGREWKVGKSRNSALQMSLLYVQGFTNIMEGSLSSWDVGPPEGVTPREAYDQGLFPEPTEQYDLFFSRGSYLCMELKYYMGLTRKKN